MSVLPESKLARYREILAGRPPRDPAQDLSWMLEEYEAAKPSIVRAMELEEDLQGEPL